MKKMSRFNTFKGGMVEVPERMGKTRHMQAFRVLGFSTWAGDDILQLLLLIQNNVSLHNYLEMLNKNSTSNQNKA